MRRFPLIALALVAVVSACSSTEPAESTVAAPSTTAATTTTPTTEAAEPVGLAGALEAAADANPTAWTRRDGIISFVAPNYTPTTGDPREAALAYFETFADAYGISDPGSRLDVIGSWESAAGTVVRFGQTLDGLPVFGGEVSVTVAGDGTVIGVSGVVVPDADLVDPALDAALAIAAAVAAVDGSEPGSAAPRAVAVSPHVDGTKADPIPGWEVEVVTHVDTVPIRTMVLIDGRDGSVLLSAGLDLDEMQYDILDAGNALDEDGDGTVADAEVVIERRAGETTVVGEADETARILAGHLEASWDYFFEIHGRDSFDDAGGLCRAYVHVGVNWRNATAGGGSCTHRYGDARAYAESLDVVAHEFAHNVTGQTAGLVYQGQSGALNEHYSDFFAAMVDRSDWDLFGIRDLSNPELDGIDEFLVTEDDNGGVHTNSGIPNRAGYMVASDETTVHPDSGIEVRGIGRQKAEHLWYATLLTLGPRTNFGAWACATINTARSLDGELLTSEDVESVIGAMTAIGLIESNEDVLECSWVTAGAGIGEPGEPEQIPLPTTTTIPEEGDACSIVGVWRLRDEDFIAEIERIGGGGPAGVAIEHYGGDYFIELREDGTLIDDRDEWSLRIVSPEGAIVVRIDSRLAGTYSVSGNTIDATLGEGTADVTLLIEMNGELVPMPSGFDVGVTVPVEPVLEGTGVYTCLGDVLIIEASSEGGGPVEVALDRVG